MADRRPDGDLVPRLRDLAPSLEYPPTPDIAPAVRRRLARGGPRPARLSVTWWRRALAFALVLLVLGATLGAFPPTRRAIAERLGLRNVAIVITVVPTPTPTPPPPATSFAPPTTSGTAPLEATLGTATALTDAQARVTFPVRVPAAPGYTAPDTVYVGTPPTGGRVAFVYRARPDLPAIPGTDIGLLLTAFRGGLDAGLFTKGIPSASGLEAVQVRGASGYWIAGGLRLFLYRDASGTIREDTIRTAGNTLLWERDGVVYRMETTLSRDDALRVAASLP